MLAKVLPTAFVLDEGDQYITFRAKLKQVFDLFRGNEKSGSFQYKVFKRAWFNQVFVVEKKYKNRRCVLKPLGNDHIFKRKNKSLFVHWEDLKIVKRI